MSYEINPHACGREYASVQAFPVVKGDERIRTAESGQRIDSPTIVPLDGLQQLAIWGLLLALGILIPWVVMYVAVLGACGRWSAKQWGIA